MLGAKVPKSNARVPLAKLLSGECSWYVQKLGIENCWKKISGDHKYGTMCFPGLSLGGFLAYKVGRASNIVTLDVSDEIIHMICCPKKDCRVTYLAMGNDLSCISHDHERIYVHVLKDILAGQWSLYQILEILDFGCIPRHVYHHFLSWI